MKIRYALTIIIAAGMMQMSNARADDYDSGYESAQHGYSGSAPDNDSSADYVQGYHSGQSQQQQQNSSDENQ